MNIRYSSLGFLLLLPLLIDAIVVETPYGRIEGFEYNSADVFLGVRYAKAPIGDLSFEKPVRVEKWNNEFLQATEFGASCYPTNLSLNAHMGNFTYSEDCLFLNLMAPKTAPEEGNRYPVMLYIHGGGFEFDTATNFGFKEIVDNFVSAGIVFATLDYRLGPFGFLTTGDDFLPGNLGLWDQLSALEFVAEIISSFGGNPDDITVFGESAGAISVSALTLSPHSNKLISKAIQLSGSFYTMPLEGDRQHALTFINAIGCSNDNLEVSKECLKTKSSEKILKVTNQVAPPLSSDKAIGSHYFPYVDGRFFPANLHELVKDAPKIPTITGVTDMEAGLWVFGDSNETFIAVPPGKYESFSAEDLKETLAKIAVNVSGLYPLLEEFFIHPQAQKSSFYLTQQVDIASDLTFVVPAFQEAIDKLHHKWPVHLYIEQHYCESPLRSKIPVEGTFHANELFYLFGASEIFPVEMNDADKRFKRNFLEGLISFVKEGKPQIAGIVWKPIDEDDHFQFMSLNATSAMKSGFFEKRMKFWTEEVVKKVDLTELKTLLPQSALNLKSTEPACQERLLWTDESEHKELTISENKNRQEESERDQC